ncbi:MAG: 3D domain-containing protein, partial [Cyanobacteria bacterium J06633_23]
LDLPMPATAQSWQSRPVNRFVLDQDTGGAIRGPGRVDIFVGTGSAAGQQAGLINTSGQLYYLLLRQ